MNVSWFFVGFIVGTGLQLIAAFVGGELAKRKASRSGKLLAAARRAFEAEMTTRGVPEIIAVTAAALIEYDRRDLAARWLMVDLQIRRPDEFPPPPMEEG